MALAFPDSPTTGDHYKVGDIIWEWNGTVWTITSRGPANFTDTATGTYSSGGKNYKYLTFNSSGTLTVDTAGLADILVVGGGGSGAQGRGGGGGAGGHLYATGAYLPVGTLTVTVGAGGPSVPSAFVASAANSGISGNASAIADYISPGGGGGACMNYNGTNYWNSAGDNGGSGGGGSGATATGRSFAGGTGFSLVGNDGGDGQNGGDGAGGGGGAGAAGSNGSSGVGGAGGAGTSNSITGSAVDRAGGGGGSGNTAGAGGSGGGGAGSYLGSGTAGTANTGGGGGGILALGAARLSGAGGSGVVIVRVEV